MATRSLSLPVDAPAPLADRVALVTGAASGIGAATARRLAADGARVVLLARRAQRLDALAAELGPERALAAPADVTDPAAIDAAAALAQERFGEVDLVVANAGIMLPAPLVELRAQDWRRMLDLNVVGLLETVRAFLPDLTAAGRDGRAADLVITSSIGARETFPGYAVYGATKAAANYLGRAWRAELAPLGVRVTVIEPGLTSTELGSHIPAGEGADLLASMFDQIPALSADDVAHAIAFAVSLPAHASIPSLTLVPARQA